MTEIIKDEQMSENSAIDNVVTSSIDNIVAAYEASTTIDNLVAAYQVAARKSCRSILEVAKCVQHARTVLQKPSDYHAYLERIVLKESDAKKLQTIAKQASRIEEHLIRNDVDLSFNALYEFAQMSDEDVAKTNVLELRTAKDFAAANSAKVAKAETKKAVKAVQAAKAAEADAKAEMPKADVEVEALFADFDSKAEAVVAAVTSDADTYVLRVSRLSLDKQVALYKELNALCAKYDIEIEMKTADELALAA